LRDGGGSRGGRGRKEYEVEEGKVAAPLCSSSSSGGSSSSSKMVSYTEEPLSIQHVDPTALVKGSSSSGSTTTKPSSYSSSLGVGVVVSFLAGVFSSLLQYAFVFGGDVVQYMEKEHGVTRYASSIVIWTVATGVNNLCQAVGLVVTMSWKGQWGRYFEVRWWWW